MYRLDPLSGVIIVATGEHILPRKSDPRWLAYQAWIREGNIPEPTEIDLVPLDVILDRKLSDVMTWSTEQHDSPIEYLSVQFDADSPARENITGTFSRLSRGDGLPSGWVGWRAFDNSMHWADSSASDVQNHLRAISTAIEDRKQSILVQAWTHKYQLQVLFDADDREGLEGYVVQ